MSDHEHEIEHGGTEGGKLASNKWTNLAIAVCLGIVGFYLWTEHRAHVYGALPYLLLLSCPLMHLFMHRSHDHGAEGHHCDHDHSSDDTSNRKEVSGASQ